MLLALTLKDALRSVRSVSAPYILACVSGGLCSGVALVLLFQALSRAPVTVVSPILATSSLFTLALAHIFLQRLESVNLLLVAGTLVSVAGVTLVVLGASN